MSSCFVYEGTARLQTRSDKCVYNHNEDKQLALRDFPEWGMLQLEIWPRSFVAPCSSHHRHLVSLRPQGALISRGSLLMIADRTGGWQSSKRLPESTSQYRGPLLVWPWAKGRFRVCTVWVRLMGLWINDTVLVFMRVFIRLMYKILHHLGCPKLIRYGAKAMFSINSISITYNLLCVKSHCYIHTIMI